MRVAGCSCYIQAAALSKQNGTQFVQNYAEDIAASIICLTSSDLSRCPDAHSPAPLLPDAAARVWRLPARKLRAVRDSSARTDSSAAGRAERLRQHHAGWSGECRRHQFADQFYWHYADHYYYNHAIGEHFNKRIHQHDQRPIGRGTNYDSDRNFDCGYRQREQLGVARAEWLACIHFIDEHEYSRNDCYLATN